MYKLISFVLLSTITQLGYTFSPLDPIIILSITNNQKVQENFTDFSGAWKGKCIIDNRESEEEVIIKNTAEYIEFGNQRAIIGNNNLHTESNVTAQGTHIDHRQFTWTENGKSLIMQGTKVLSDGLKTFIFTDEMSLMNDQLIIDIQIRGFKYSKQIQEANGNCLLTRSGL